MYKVQNETLVENISIQNLTPGGATVTLDGTNLDPAPFVSLSVEQYRAGDLIIGGSLIVSLNGTVYTTTNGGFSDVANQLKSKFHNIGKKGDCIPLSIDCNGTSLVNGEGVIRSVTIDEGPEPSWTQVAAYSIEVELYINDGQLVVEPNGTASSYVTTNEIIKDLSESITLNVDNDSFAVDPITGGNKAGRAHAKYSFSISATGGAVGCNSLGKKVGLDAAEEVIKRRINLLAAGNFDLISNPSSLNSVLTNYIGGYHYLQVRSVDADAITGTMTVNGELILRPTGITYPQAFIELSVDTRADTSQVGRNVTISGTIEGLYSTGFSDIITNPQFHAASTNRIGNAETVYSALQGSFVALANAYLGGLISDTNDCTTGGLLSICSSIVPSTECGVRLVSRSVTRNMGSGTISFSEEYSTAKNCAIAGAAKVESDVTHTYPTDVFAEFTIPFRGTPLIQNLGTTTKEVISVNVNVTVENPGCDIRDLTGIQGCAITEADSLGASEGAAGWYLTQFSITRGNTGTIRISKEWTKPYNC